MNIKEKYFFWVEKNKLNDFTIINYVYVNYFFKKSEGFLYFISTFLRRNHGIFANSAWMQKKVFLFS